MKKNKTLPLVSIIMNCHNGEKYLSESLQSILSQTYKNWELIFFDNLSKDNSKKILKSVKDKRIKYFKSKKFLKLYDARNQAIKKTKGKYIFFLDSDDRWKKKMINTQVTFMESNDDYDMVYSNYYIFHQDKKNLSIPYNYELPSGFITKQILKKYPIGILTTCIRKKIFEKKAFKTKYNIIGDFDFFVKMSIKNKIGCIQKPLAYYRLHDSNFSKKNLKMYLNEMSQWINENYLLFKSMKINLIHQKFLLIRQRLKYFLLIIRGINFKTFIYQ